ncbi:MAG TPA: CPBP family intramembrane glutamic endopeptidase [Pyrinomonadaceae bacterium]
MQNEEFKKINYTAPPVRNFGEPNTTTPVDIAPTPDNPPWNGWAAIGVWILSIVFIIVFPLIFILPYLANQKLDFADKAAVSNFVLSDKTAVILQLLSVIPSHLFTILVAWLVVTRFRKYSFRQMLGWKMGGFRFFHIFLIIVGFFALSMLATAIFGEQTNDFMKILESSRTAVFLVAIFATFTAPLVEEVVYRGMLYSAFQRRIGVIWSVVAVTFLFALVHVPQYSKGWVPDFATVSVILLLSLVLTLIRARTGNLLPCIVLHTVFNGIQSILMILMPYIEPYFNSNQGKSGWIIHFLK